MLTEKVTVNGIEYQVSAHTYKMLKDAKEQLLKSIERYEQEHPSAPIPETSKKTTTNESNKKARRSSK